MKRASKQRSDSLNSHLHTKFKKIEIIFQKNIKIFLLCFYYSKYDKYEQTPYLKINYLIQDIKVVMRPLPA